MDNAELALFPPLAKSPLEATMSRGNPDFCPLTDAERQEVVCRAAFTYSDKWQENRSRIDALDQAGRRQLLRERWPQLQETISTIVDELKEPETEVSPASTVYQNFRQHWAERIAREDFFDAIAENSIVIINLCTFADCLSELIRVYKEVGYWQLVRNGQIGTFENQAIEDRERDFLENEQGFFKLACTDLIAPLCLGSSAGPISNNDFRAWDDELRGIIGGMANFRFRQIEPLQDRQTPIDFRGFAARPQEAAVLRAFLQVLLPQKYLSHLDRFAFDAKDPPPTIDQRGQAWYTVATWAPGVQEAVFHPRSCGNPQADGTFIPQLTGLVPAAMHEIGGHYFDVDMPENQHLVPPWIRLRMAHALDRDDPFRHPATNYVKHVVEEHTSANVISGKTREMAPWEEQFAEMMMLFRQNPRQFATYYDKDTLRAFTMFCLAAEGSERQLFDERVQAWSIVKAYSRMKRDSYLTIEEAAVLAGEIMEPTLRDDDTPFKGCRKDLQRFCLESLRGLTEIETPAGLRYLLYFVAEARSRLISHGQQEETYTLVDTTLGGFLREGGDSKVMRIFRRNLQKPSAEDIQRARERFGLLRCHLSTYDPNPGQLDMATARATCLDWGFFIIKTIYDPSREGVKISLTVRNDVS